MNKEPTMQNNSPIEKNPMKLESNWIKLCVDSKFLFYNIKDHIVTFHPPFPLENISTFLNYYHFSINEIEFISILNTKSNEYKDDHSSISSNKKKKTSYDTLPLTDEKKIKELIALSHHVTLDKIITQIFNYKYNECPSYQYTSKDKNKPQQCNIKLKDTVLFTSNLENSRVLAKRSVDRITLKALVPKISKQILSMMEKKKIMDRIPPDYNNPNNKNYHNKAYLEHKRARNLSIENIKDNDLILPDDEDTSEGSSEKQSHHRNIKVFLEKNITEVDIDENILYDLEYTPMKIVNVLKMKFPKFGIGINNSKCDEGEKENEGNGQVIEKNKVNTIYVIVIKSKLFGLKIEERNKDKRLGCEIAAMKFIQEFLTGTIIESYSQLVMHIKNENYDFLDNKKFSKFN